MGAFEGEVSFGDEAGEEGMPETECGVEEEGECVEALPAEIWEEPEENLEDATVNELALDNPGDDVAEMGDYLLEEDDGMSAALRFMQGDLDYRESAGTEHDSEFVEAGSEAVDDVGLDDMGVIATRSDAGVETAGSANKRR